MLEDLKGASCPLCGSQDLSAVLVDREDFEYGVSERLHYWRCSACTLVFACPLPDTALLASFYARYSTHRQEGTAESRLGQWLQRALDRARTEELRAAFRSLSSAPRCLDYGCGAGAALERLRTLGAAEVCGYEPDPMARMQAARLGMHVHESEREALADGPYDLVLLDHVIEHLPDPVATLGTLASAMRPGAVLIARTPNTRSLLSYWFEERWRGWETPRHLNLLSRSSVLVMARRLREPGLELQSLKSSNRMFLGMLQGSLALPPNRHRALMRHTLSLPAWAFAEGVRWLGRFTGSLTGEELVIQWRKPPSGFPPR